MSFLERVVNLCYGLMYEIYFNYVHLPRQNQIMKKYFPGVPNLDVLMYNNVSMVFLNSHFIVTGAKPLVPAFVEIGGFHIDEENLLPADLQEILDNASTGAIYFSLGSNLKSDDLPEDVVNVILKTFSKLNHTVLWKMSEDRLNKTANIITGSWFPQNAILAHPNTKVFITHGGLLSITEAVYFGVPIIGIPVFADQPTNVRIMQENGFGLKLDILQLTEEIFSKTLQELIHNPKYKNTTKRHSTVLRHRPIKPVDEIIFWSEFVMNNHAKLLRSPAMNLHWTQIYLLDVIGFLIIFIVLGIALIFTLIKKICFLKQVAIVTKEKKH